MKARTMIFCLLCLCGMVVQAQEKEDGYTPLVQDGKILETEEYVHEQGRWQKATVRRYRIEGDTLIGGQTWKKVFYSRFSLGIYTGKTTKEDLGCVAVIREEGRKVYGMGEGDRERLLYDFGMEAGDTVRCGIDLGQDNCHYLYCILGQDDEWTSPFRNNYVPMRTMFTTISVDTVDADDRQLRRFTNKPFFFKEPFSEVRMPESAVWVEGVGSLAGLFDTWSFYEPAYYITRCIMDGKVLYEGGFSDKDRGFTGIAPISLQSTADAPLFDLQGRRLTAKPQRGVYIQGGRKYVVK